MGEQAKAEARGATLCVLGGFYAGLEVPIDRDRIVIGRGRDADLVLADSTISRVHAAVGFAEGGCYVEDLKSTNGTRVNGERCARAQLRDGDEIQLGRVQLRIRLGS